MITKRLKKTKEKNKKEKRRKKGPFLDKPTLFEKIAFCCKLIKNKTPAHFI